MKITAWQVGPGGLAMVPENELTPDWNELSRALEAEDHPYWIDVVGASPEWVTEALTAVGAGPAIQRRISHHHHMVTALSSADISYFRLPVTRRHRYEREFLNVLWSERQLVTWRPHEAKGLKRLAHRLDDPSEAVLITSLPRAIVAICVALAVNSYEYSQRLRHQIDKMEDDADSWGEIRGDLNEADSRLHLLDEITSAYAQVFAMIRNEGLDFDGDPTPMAHLDDAINITSSVARSLRTLYNRLTTLRQRQAEYSSQKTNARLGVLSVLSAIFLPLTLLTGIYGMNFTNMPELGVRWAYPVLLMFMVTITGSLWVFFRRKGWP